MGGTGARWITGVESEAMSRGGCRRRGCPRSPREVVDQRLTTREMSNIRQELSLSFLQRNGQSFALPK